MSAYPDFLCVTGGSAGGHLAAPVVHLELDGAEHAFDVFPSHRCARVVEGVVGYLTAVHRAHLMATEPRL